MGKIYSEDLRLRAVELIDSGKSVLEVERMLKIGKTTLYVWLKRRFEKGHLKADEPWQKGYGHSIQDLEAFTKFVQDNAGLTAKQMSEKLGGVSAKTVCKWLHRIGFMRKKRVTATMSKVKSSVSYIWSN